MMMNEQPIHVTARLYSRPDTQEALRRALAALTGPTRAEPGCLRYDLFQNAGQPEEFLFIEQWRTAGDLERHLQQPHIQSFIRISGDLLAGPMQVAQWQAVD
jgi:quinol monooxygenase YgiN